jgi:hypothetical protein
VAQIQRRSARTVKAGFPEMCRAVLTGFIVLPNLSV